MVNGKDVIMLEIVRAPHAGPDLAERLADLDLFSRFWTALTNDLFAVLSSG